MNIRDFVIVVCSLLLITACSKDTQSKLYGKWQLQEVEINGAIEKVDTIYFNFQQDLFMYQIYQPQSHSYSYRYGYDVMEGEHTVHLELVNDPGPLSSFLPLTDWSSAKRTYTIDKLSNKQLIMSSEGKTYTFRKY
ncbi:MAG: hypothetical protein E7085_10685 [Parabacteroides distasonis]|nr:hypothetical protein [Parabacteroides distasonis]MBR2497639.1 lipocalin-like domain-containing protein [Parabacteroides sp.]